MAGRRDPADAVAEFLRTGLANKGPVVVSDLEAMARTAGLLGQSQQIGHARTFKKAKKDLDIRSVRVGFGVGGRWAWVLPTQPVPVATDLGSAPDIAHEEVRPGAAADDLEKLPTELQERRIPLEWVNGIARLDDISPPTDIPRHRWHILLADCNEFMTSSENWAERAATLGWSAYDLFGCRSNRPLEHLGSAVLLWAINGSRLVELRRDWAVFERAANKSRNVFQRRRVAAADVTLPWIGLRQRPGNNR